MRFDYDPEAGAGYVYVSDALVFRHIEVLDGSVIVDVDEDGALVGVEIIDPEGAEDD